MIDYRQQDFRCTGRRYDLIVDLVGNRSLRYLRAVCGPAASWCCPVAGVSGQGRVLGPLGLLLRSQMLAAATDLRISTPKAVPNTAVLTELGQQLLLSTSLIHPVLDRTFGLADTAPAIDYLETHHARAKVVITVDDHD